MSSDGVDTSRRRFLTATTGVVGAVGAVFTAVPFVQSFNPSAKAKSAGAPVTVDVGKMEEGAMLRAKYRGQPVFIIKRPKAVLKDIEATNSMVADPESKEPQQPIYAANQYRSIRDEYLVVIGLCTHLGCAPLYKTELDAVSAGHIGGFYCPCHGSKFDMAGRVYSGVPAQLNLLVPPHSFIDNETLIIGVDSAEEIV